MSPELSGLSLRGIIYTDARESAISVSVDVAPIPAEE